MAKNSNKVQNAPKAVEVVASNANNIFAILELEKELQKEIKIFLQKYGSQKELNQARRKAKLDAIKADPKLYAEFKAARKEARDKRIEELKKDPHAYNVFLTKKNERAKIRRDRVKKALALLKEQEKQAELQKQTKKAS